MLRIGPAAGRGGERPPMAWRGRVRPAGPYGVAIAREEPIFCRIRALPHFCDAICFATLDEQIWRWQVKQKRRDSKDTHAHKEQYGWFLPEYLRMLVGVARKIASVRGKIWEARIQKPVQHHSFVL